jgi:hypothetical protein
MVLSRSCARGPNWHGASRDGPPKADRTAPRALRVVKHGIAHELSNRVFAPRRRQGAFKTVTIGRRVYLLRSEIEDALRELGATP